MMMAGFGIGMASMAVRRRPTMCSLRPKAFSACLSTRSLSLGNFEARYQIYCASTHACSSCRVEGPAARAAARCRTRPSPRLRPTSSSRSCARPRKSTPRTAPAPRSARRLAYALSVKHFTSESLSTLILDDPCWLMNSPESALIKLTLPRSRTPPAASPRSTARSPSLTSPSPVRFE